MHFTCSTLEADRTISSAGPDVVDICCVFREGCSQGGTYEFWMAIQAIPPIFFAVMVILSFALSPNSIIRRLPMVVPGLRVKFQCKRDQECMSAADVWSNNSAAETKFLSAAEAEQQGYATTNKVVFQFEAYNRILHPERHVLLLCLLFPVLYVILYVWDKAMVRKSGYVAYPQSECDNGFDCFWSSEEYRFLSWPTYQRLDCMNHSRLDPPEGAEFYKCFGVVFSFRELIGAFADAGSILVVIVVLLCYKSSAPASLMQAPEESEGASGGISVAAERLERDILYQKFSMCFCFILAAASVGPGLWAYGRYVNSLESLALFPALFCFLAFLSMSQLRVNRWLLAKIHRIPPGSLEEVLDNKKNNAQFRRSGTKQALTQVDMLNFEDPETVARCLHRLFSTVLDENDSGLQPLKKLVKQVIEEEAAQKKTSIYDFVLSNDKDTIADEDEASASASTRLLPSN